MRSHLVVELVSGERLCTWSPVQKMNVMAGVAKCQGAWVAVLNLSGMAHAWYLKLRHGWLMPREQSCPLVEPRQ